MDLPLSGVGGIPDSALDASATVVKAKLLSSSSTYTDCTISGGTSVTCDFSPDVSVTSADQLSVVAHS